jgi:hypothetical protein
MIEGLVPYSDDEAATSDSDSDDLHQSTADEQVNNEPAAASTAAVGDDRCTLKRPATARNCCLHEMSKALCSTAHCCTAVGAGLQSACDMAPQTEARPLR